RLLATLHRRTERLDREGVAADRRVVHVGYLHGADRQGERRRDAFVEKCPGARRREDERYLIRRGRAAPRPGGGAATRHRAAGRCAAGWCPARCERHRAGVVALAAVLDGDRTDREG